MDVVAVVLIGAVVMLIVAAAMAAVGFRDRIEELKMRLVADQRLGRPLLPRLPPLVRDYALKAGGREGGPSMLHARQSATLATARDRPPMAISAQQWTAARTPGIVWVAEGAMSGVPVSVVDSFVDGKGHLAARLLRVLPVAGGTGEAYDKGELMRYLSELPIYPDAILNVGAIQWRQVDVRTVEASARAGSQLASVRFVFDDNGDISALEADDRPMERDGALVPTPWRGSYSSYRQFGSYRLPAHGEVGWLLADGLFTYWRGDLLDYRPVSLEAGQGRRAAPAS
jgi:hypothetical protein